MLGKLRWVALTPFDTRDRHLAVGRLLEHPGFVADIGGVPGQLTHVLPRGTRCITVNIEQPADILYDGAHLPFGDGELDTVTSLDVLEHIPCPDRSGFVAELLRVTRRQLVFCCPVASPGHAQAEAELLKWLQQRGQDNRWLAEHVKHGLPTAEEVAEYFAGRAHETFFHGDYRLAATAARGREACCRVRPVPRWPEMRLTREMLPWSNRVFVRAGTP